MRREGDTGNRNTIQESKTHHQVIPDPICHWLHRGCSLVGDGIQHAHSDSVPISGFKRVHFFDLCKGQTSCAQGPLAHKGKHTAHIGTCWWLAGRAYCPAGVAAQVAEKALFSLCFGRLLF